MLFFNRESRDHTEAGKKIFKRSRHVLNHFPSIIPSTEIIMNPWLRFAKSGGLRGSALHREPISAIGQKKHNPGV